MIGLLPIGRVIAIVAVIYAALVALAIGIVGNRGSLGDIDLALSGATVLQLVLMVWFYFGWRRLWRWFPILNRWLFPDIEGEWKMRINWHQQGDAGVVDAVTTIKQNFLRISMEVRSPSSDSQTLIAQPRRDSESGTPLLYYVYLVSPKAGISNSSHSAYHGAAILKFFEAKGGQLRGNYWTTHDTKGHFQLSR